MELILTSKTPKLDLHEEIVTMVNSLVTEFIKDNYKMGEKVVRIVHGKSTNILTREVHLVLSKNKLIKEYSLNRWNLGETIVVIKDK